MLACDYRGLSKADPRWDYTILMLRDVYYVYQGVLVIDDVLMRPVQVEAYSSLRYLCFIRVSVGYLHIYRRGVRLGPPSKCVMVESDF